VARESESAGAITAGRRVLITGGTSGIGLATAVRLSEHGARVAVLARNPAGLAAVRRQTAAVGAPCETFAVDVTDRPLLERQIAAAAAALGGLDVAVVNVGASTYGRFVETTAEDFDRVVDVSFRSAVDTVRAVLPALERSAGNLVVVGSVAGEVPLPLMAAYTAAKHALRGFVDALRVELRAQGSTVSVSVVEPGPVDTPFWRNVATVNGLPPGIPFAYAPQEVAIAIEHSANSGAARSTVGASWAAVRVAHQLFRPLSERLISVLMRAMEKAGPPGEGRAAIWSPSGTGEQELGLRSRPSLLVRGRHRAEQALRRLRA
jgi:short-subunit dehydrogenase